MPEIVPGLVDALFVNFRGDFQEALVTAPVWSPRLFTKIESTSRENRYYWVDKIPRLRRWVGPRIFNSLSARAYALPNEDWEDSVKMDRNVIDDDGAIGFLRNGVRMLGVAAARWADDMLVDIMQNGNSASNSRYLCYDGQPFFSTAHPTNIDNPSQFPNQSNYTVSGLALNPANYNTVRVTMMNYLGADGKPLGIVPNLLVVPPQLEQVARQILNSDYTAPAAALGGNAASVMQSNTLQGSADLLVVPQLASNPGQWYLAQTGGPVNPFVFQERKAPDLQLFVNPTDLNNWENREYKMGVDCRGAIGYTFWFLCYQASA
jgi:phage major head subunit gpT-like protein